MVQTTCWVVFLCFSDFKFFESAEEAWVNKGNSFFLELFTAAWQGFYHYLRFEVMLKS